MSAPASAALGPGRSRGSIRGRGSTRGLGATRGRARAGSNARGTSRLSSFATAAGSQIQRHLQPPPRSNQTRPRGRQNAAESAASSRSQARRASASSKEAWRTAVTDYNAAYKGRMSDLYQQLKESRDAERKQAIKDGFLADPDKPTSLAHAITPVGTCQDMCPEFERVERIVQMMVDTCEKETAESGSKVPCEALMVKRFRRSAAGYDEQLPSDIRPPAILKKTLDYLINDVVGGAESLATIHKFVWDRTRGIRNDFSIQQVTRTEDLRLAIECFERIARFHILALHQLSRIGLKDNEFDHHQEREQLNNTLLSLMYYYDDSRHKLTSANEAEFRAYCIIFEIRDQRPDLEDRVQSWPRSILRDLRVQTALKIYAAAGNISDEQGPLRPRTTFALAQANAGGFWALVKSNTVSYLTACVAEIYFNLVRGSALELIWKAYKAKRGGSTKVEDWIFRDLTPALGFDDDDQTASFCEEHGFVISNGDKDELFIDLSSVASNQIGDSNPRRKQIFSKSIVEKKRLGRTFPAIVDGFSASQAQQQGFIEESDTEDLSDANEESLFLDDVSDTEQQERQASRSASPEQVSDAGKGDSEVRPLFGAGFGTPPQMPNPFAKTKQNSLFSNSSPGFNAQEPSAKPNPFAPAQGSLFTSSTSKLGTATETATKPNPFALKDNPAVNPFFKQSSAQAVTSVPTKDQVVDATEPNPSIFSGSPAAANSSRFPNPFVQKPNNWSENAFSNSQPSESVQGLSTTSVFAQPTSVLTSDTSRPSGDAAQSKPPTFSWTAPSAPPVDSSNLEKLNKSQSARPENKGLNSSGGSALPPLSFAPANKTSAKTEVKASPFPFSSSDRRDKNLQTDLTSSLATPKVSASGQESNASEGLFRFPSFTPPVAENQAPLPEPYSAGSTKSMSKLFTTTNSTPSTSQSSSLPTAETTNLSLSSAAAKKTNSNATLASGLSSDSGLASSSVHSGPGTPSTKANPTDIRAKALDQLAEIMMTEEGGLLQQFVEYSVTPIIRSCVAKFEDEESWARAKRYRTILLGKKYFARWKITSWNLGVRRRAKERRGRLARSVLGASQRPGSSLNGVLKFPSESSTVQESASFRARGAMQAPPVPFKTSKRQSMPSKLIEDGRALLASFNANSAGQKRKRDASDLNDTNGTNGVTSLQRHKRSNTLAASSISAPPHTLPRSSLRRSIDSNRIGDGSLLGSILKEQAQKLAPFVKSDTTNTDYFKLKALGIDPDTPLVPKTKRKATTSASNGSLNTPSVKRIMPAVNGALKPPPQALNDDDDEALFASIANVRETLSESTSWFHTEWQSLERSVTPHQSQVSPPRSETAAERRLRELKERGPTPTRSEIRYRAMKDKSHLPNGFWDRSPAASPQQNGGHDYNHPNAGVASPSTPSKLRGFAALASKSGSASMVNGKGGQSSQRESPFGQSGGSADEAIEL